MERKKRKFVIASLIDPEPRKSRNRTRKKRRRDVFEKFMEEQKLIPAKKHSRDS